MKLSGTPDMSIIIIQIKHANEQSNILQSLNKDPLDLWGWLLIYAFICQFYI